MPEQVTIEFVGDATQLQPAVESIENLQTAGTKLNTEFKNTTKVFGDTTKASQVAHLSIDQLSASVRDLNKNVIGNDAQNKVKELGTQFASSANEGKKLTTELRELKDQLSRLAQSGQAGTAEFAKLQTQAAKVQDQVNKTNKSIQILSQSGGAIRALTTVVSGLAGAFAVAQGATALLGDKNKDLEKTLLKVQAVMLILNGITSIQATLQEAATIKTAAYGAALKVVTFLQNAFTISAEAAWAAATGGIAAVITAVTAVILFFRQGADQAATATDKLKASLDGLSDSFDKIERRAGNVAAINARLIQDQEDLIQRLIDQNTSANQSDDARLAHANAIYQAQLKLIDLKKKANADELATAEASLKNLQDQQSEFVGVMFRMGEFAQATDKEVEEATKSYNSLAKQVATVKNRIFELTNNTQDFTTAQVAANKQLRETIDLLGEAVAQGLAAQEQLQKAEDAAHKMAADRLQSIVEGIIFGQEVTHKELEDLVNEEQDFQNRQDALTKKHNKERIAQEIQFVSTMKGLGDALFQFTLNTTQQEIDALEDKHRRGIISDKQYNKAIAEARRKQALAEKEKAVFDIGINTATGIMAALGSTPPNVPLAVIIGATGAAELAAVLSKKLPEVPKFASGTESVKGGVRGKDSVPAILMPGERVVPTAINEKLRGIPNAELPKLLDLYPETPYISDATLDSIERGRSNHTGIDYDRLGQSVAKYIAKHPRLNISLDEHGFQKTLIDGANKQKSLDNYYSWKG